MQAITCYYNDSLWQDTHYIKEWTQLVVTIMRFLTQVDPIIATWCAMQVWQTLNILANIKYI